ncbi:peroxidase 1-like [Wolffia australiana]
MSRTTPGVLFVAFVLAVHSLSLVAPRPLKSGFYGGAARSGAHRESVVGRLWPPTGHRAGLIRLHFHDCRQVPQTVSCADVLAFARALRVHRGIRYKVPPDGATAGSHSRLRPMCSHPHSQAPRSSARTLKEGNVAGRHGGALRAHSWASPTAPPSLAGSRLQRHPPAGSSMDAGLASTSETLPASGGTPPQCRWAWPRPTSWACSTTGTSRREGVLISTRPSGPAPTANLVNSFAKPNLWAKKCADAMVRMGAIGVLTGNQGEIRVKCSVVNSL